jgi:aspartyl-tRNA(Asn)/glutamyl-tRNA(Gln) amidotransferase subunit A
VTTKLFADGAVMLGKTNLDEFAMGSSNTTSYYGNAINPWKANDSDADLVPGGSSGGSAVAVAANIAMISTGTDTGGSIRQPAAFCGIAGMRPTYGRCSRWGVVAFASSLDQAGSFGRSVEDCALMLNSMSGFDPKDSTSAKVEVPDFSAMIDQGVKGLKVGIPKEYKLDDTPAEINALWEQGIEWLRAEGAEIIDISLPHTKYALPAYYIIAPAEASSNLSRYDGVRYGLRVDGDDLQATYCKSRAAGFGDEVKRRIMVGAYVLSAGYYDAYYIKAQKVRRLIQNDFIEAYKKVDVILTPATPSSAFPIGENEDDPIKMYLNDIFTVTVNMAGLPGMSVPAGTDSRGLPLGLQVIGRPFDEATILRTCRFIEKSAAFCAKPKFLLNKAA